LLLVHSFASLIDLSREHFRHQWSGGREEQSMVIKKGSREFASHRSARSFGFASLARVLVDTKKKASAASCNRGLEKTPKKPCMLSAEPAGNVAKQEENNSTVFFAFLYPRNVHFFKRGVQEYEKNRFLPFRFHAYVSTFVL
jgi:hypothetical protein